MRVGIISKSASLVEIYLIGSFPIHKRIFVNLIVIYGHLEEVIF